MLPYVVYYCPCEGVASVFWRFKSTSWHSAWLELNCETHVLRELTWTPLFLFEVWPRGHTFLFY